jgi:hypothetical protein
MPEIQLPEVKLPEGLRDMTKDDIVQAVKEVKMPKVDLSDLHLPDEINDRLPGRRRTNPLIPLVALTAVGALIAAAWWLITSPVTGPRIRRAVDDVKSRMNGQDTDMIRYDNETDLASLVSHDDASTFSAPTSSDPYGIAPADDDGAVAVGPGMSEEEMRARVD